MDDENINLDDKLFFSQTCGKHVYCWDYFETKVTRKHFDYPEVQVIGFAGGSKHARFLILKDILYWHCHR